MGILRKIFRFGPYIPFTNLAVVYFGKRLSEGSKKRMAYKRNAKIQKIIHKYTDLSPRSFPPSEISDTTKAPIWFCWLQGEKNLPEIPKICLQSIRRHANGHPVIMLDANNYRQYVNLNERIVLLHEQGRLKNAHFADIMRVNLLAQQGGLWLDATMLVTSDIPDWVFNFPFFSIKTAPYGNFVSQCRWAVFCLGRQKGCPVFTEVSRLFNDYLAKQDEFVDYFMFDQFIDLLYQTNPEIRRMVDDVPINNPEVHALAKILDTEFDESCFTRLISETFLFKLSWKKAANDSLNNTYLQHIAHLS